MSTLTQFLPKLGVPVAAAAGTADAITATFTPAITLVDQMIVAVVLSGANTLTNPTFAPNGLTARTIVKNGGTALVAGDLPAALAVALLEYNLANTRWELLNPQPAGLRSAAAVAVTGGTVTGITDLVVADGGTGVSTFTDAGVLIGNAANAIQVTSAGTAGQVLTSNGAGVDPTFQAAGGITLGTEIATTSGTTADFTGLPAAVKQIVVSWIGVSWAANPGTLQLLLGDAGGFETTGYVSMVERIDSPALVTILTSTTEFLLIEDTGPGASPAFTGQIILTLEDSSDFTWVMHGWCRTVGVDTYTRYLMGNKATSQALSQIRLTSSLAATFDAGVINIAYQS